MLPAVGVRSCCWLCPALPATSQPPTLHRSLLLWWERRPLPNLAEPLGRNRHLRCESCSMTWYNRIDPTRDEEPLPTRRPLPSPTCSARCGPVLSRLVPTKRKKKETGSQLSEKEKKGQGGRWRRLAPLFDPFRTQMALFNSFPPPVPDIHNRPSPATCSSPTSSFPLPCAAAAAAKGSDTYALLCV